MDAARLVLIHPIGNNRQSWQLLELEQPRVGYYEMPGHGQKPRHPGLTTAWMADDLVREFDGPLHLLGSAVGAFVALNALVRHPERIRSAILVNGGPGGVSSPTVRQALIRRGEGPIRDGMASVVEETFGRWFTPYARRTRPPGVELARRILLEMDPRAWSDIWRATATSEPVPAERIAAVDRPVSLVACTNDAAGVLAGSARLHALLPCSRLHYVAGPHMVHLERPRSLASAIAHHFGWLDVSASRIDAPLYFAGE